MSEARNASTGLRIGLLRRAVLELHLALLLDVEAKILEQHDVAGLEFAGCARRFNRRADAVVEKLDFSPEQFLEFSRDRLERELRDLLAIGPAEMATSARPTRPCSSAYLIVGSAATMRWLLVIAPVALSCGTLKSTRISTRFPLRFRSRMVLNLGMAEMRWQEQ